MTRNLDPELFAKDGRKLRVLGIARVSKGREDSLSLQDQEALYRRWIEQHTKLPFELICLASEAKGECVDRADVAKAELLIAERSFDLVLLEDLGRYLRRVHAHLFCEACEDYDTRLIAINDHVDTYREDWRLNSFFAVFRHESYNTDTAKRIRRSQRNRFSQGGVFQCAIYGYVKPKGAKGEADVCRDPAAEQIYDEWFRKLEDGAGYEEVADWLNEHSVPTGPYARSSRWSGKMVQRITFNPILKGIRQRNRKMSRRVNKTGRRVAVNAPAEELLERFCEHFVFIDPQRYDRVIRLLKQRNCKYRRGKSDGVDCRRNVSKKRTRWPGQSVQCGVCGRPFVYGGHGQTDHLMCSGAREYRCWNGVTFDGAIARQRMSSAVLQLITEIPDFDRALLPMLQEIVSGSDAERTKRIVAIRNEQNRLDREKRNLLAAIREMGPSPSLRSELASLESHESEIQNELQDLEYQSKPQIVLPTMDAIRSMARDALLKLDFSSQDFARAMRTIVQPIFVFPYRLFDGGHVVLRAHMHVTLVPFVDRQIGCIPEVASQLSKVITVDLFKPPQRVEFREEVVHLTTAANESLNEREIATQLKITQPAVQNAKRLERELKLRGLNDPYLPATAPPEDYSKMRRHKHKRYQFEPLEGFPRGWPT